MPENNKKPRTLKGTVVSDKMTKTAVIEIARMVKHPKYKKFVKLSKRFKAHNPENQFHVGDKVTIQESKPISKDKRWVITGKVQ
ncbi:MAG: 30S ribosomal protein S17 [Candidatus Yanofskybacteria bacterium RIFCSPLOWO2_12_FULL_44_13b]|uniref:Small ribosomal subunit protein uS17 n=1 Tax=Candidatus Yanofskybacteria bacterium RIFCSPLOWO2_02_FULL_44_18 TaxID=1802705 RepID=A0A1F8H273_9BACT|nr:MAG: 30S ribosomal protein S17 [Candidatus Yanofskybacteria bacterium RIFCSPHIGHO2_01_FULL_44_110b]OGN14840.1 MAG: 30S ribosomal protein S17 [Candidatus Yanofskybacteria bacterium RIFCSPHIGHO2_02_FULL_44_36b]OGN19118.1 MAG: 30S ribosomal protein S17 [Candidatus Yanofskybacteria bacterium RIFCSPHIGHO2_12_FULL_44_29b]OGN26373.1 MAG: 30S ribosomal protein S17 [Candidatus Yanofskybacteria bacterium RIFCSPLOWO2_01_FULL_44_88]OGN31370.1 MAG: 30S ribosomal protein S17 [Candidatus Yanofskybacteria b